MGTTCAALPATTYGRLSQQLRDRAKQSVDPRDAADLLRRAAIWEKLAATRIPNSPPEHHFPCRSAQRGRKAE